MVHAFFKSSVQNKDFFFEYIYNVFLFHAFFKSPTTYNILLFTVLGKYGNET